MEYYLSDHHFGVTPPLTFTIKNPSFLDSLSKEERKIAVLSRMVTEKAVKDTVMELIMK
jgi:hypothetical protein